MTARIESQIERFAPGFRDCILARHTMSPAQMEAYNPNYFGGDITGGALDSHEGQPGPIYLQGSEAGHVAFRNITIAPAK